MNMQGHLDLIFLMFMVYLETIMFVAVLIHNIIRGTVRYFSVSE